MSNCQDAARPIPEGVTIFCLPTLWSTWTTGSQSGLTKHRVDRVDLSNTYRVIVGLLVMGLGLWGSTIGHTPATVGLLVCHSVTTNKISTNKNATIFF